jgi:hypothetical protein
MDAAFWALLAASLLGALVWGMCLPYGRRERTQDDIDDSAI